ncbi:Rubredoxin [Moraxella catarrhalis]|uniref:Rubredoxin n=3 Tax=Moraxella TaxID=475 RepID=A0A198UUF3_MORCA|nr:Rubredoxin [Moraxella catarrhalis]OAU94710.1 Rubredoxin [Moraxella catarrhalis]OAU99966.1 Rubredoxin [Moraxella catarrhalis]OAV03091.1 Rubredoxin [Moraxella catarrhalis]
MIKPLWDLVDFLRSKVIMKKYQCIVCGWIYDEALGCPEEGLAPGTRWEDVPDDWLCPECGVGKEDFEMVEI